MSYAVSAEILRRAAALMRERAEKVAGYTDEWYTAGELADFLLRVDVPNSAQGCDAEHIASWHPAVALAVADWLDYEAQILDRLGVEAAETHALTVARVYLR